MSVPSTPIYNAVITSTFLLLTCKLKNEILAAQPAAHRPDLVPDFLPPSVEAFLASVCKIPTADVAMLWSILKETIWEKEENGLLSTILDDRAQEAAFRQYGMEHGFCAYICCSAQYTC